KDLAFHRGARMLRAATQSRGMWEIPVDLQTQPGVEVYMRDTVVDTGRLTPSLSNVDDPFTTGQRVFWWQSPDIKVDISPFHTPALGDVDFAVFADDQSMRDNGIEFAVGLRDERPQRNRPARVYVQVHNRGIQDATNVAVKVFTTPAAGTLPDLPANF